jgi:hypothetical protein
VTATRGCQDISLYAHTGPVTSLSSIIHVQVVASRAVHLRETRKSVVIGGVSMDEDVAYDEGGEDEEAAQDEVSESMSERV